MKLSIFKDRKPEVHTHDRGRGKPYGSVHHEVRLGRDWSDFFTPGGIMGHTIAIKYPGHTETHDYKSNYIPATITVYRVNNEVREPWGRTLDVTEIMSMPAKGKGKS